MSSLQHRISSGKFLGLRVDKPDFRDVYFRDTKYKPGVPVVDVDWTSRICNPWDQGEIGSCVAHGTASLVKYVYPNIMPSRLKIYYDGRFIEKTTRQDSGLEVRDGVKASVFGVCDESLWAYDTTKFKRKPPALCYKTQNERFITEYARVGKTSRDVDILDEMQNSLCQGSPIVFGATLYESFESKTVEKSGILPMPTTREKPIGGHCMAVFGMKVKEKLFKVRNSWGVDWGDKGYVWMPFEYLINTDLTSDQWMITK